MILFVKAKCGEKDVAAHRKDKPQESAFGPGETRWGNGSCLSFAGIKGEIASP